MLRTWSEHLPFDDARQPEVLELLEHGGLHPLFAVDPEADLDALALLLEAVRARGLEPGVWPLLRDEEGYWPSERNAPAYLGRLESLLGWLERARVLPGWVAVDLEPPLFQVERLRHELGAPTELARQLGENLDTARFARAVSTYRGLTEQIRARGARTLAVTLPMAAHDLRDGAPLWQDALEAPWAPVPWDRAGIMAYGSMVAGYSRGWLSVADARAIHYRLLEHLARAFGPRAHASLGVTGAGKLGDEPAYQDPRELALDVGAARAAGVEDLAIFCLEGTLGQPEPGAWVDAVVGARPRRPQMTARAHAVRLGARGARALLGGWRAWGAGA